jgi:hypothetical protein
MATATACFRKKPSPLTAVKRAARAGNAPLQIIARVGYVARGMVYLVVGIMALSAGLGARRNALGITGALQEVLQNRLGTVLVLGIAAGMACFALWRIAQGLLDADNLGQTPRALIRRVAYAVSSLAYFAVAATAVGTIFQVSTFSPRSWAAWILGWPLGSTLLGLVGFGFLAVAATTAMRAFRALFKEELDLEPSTKKWLVPIGRAGHGARSIIFVLIGYFLVISAARSNTHEVRDMGGALNALQDQQFGMILYSSVALGLTAFGAFEFIQAFYRKVGSLREVDPCIRLQSAGGEDE